MAIRRYPSERPGLEHLRSAGPCVVVSNHQSSLDPIVQLRTLPVSLRVLAMRELFQIPLFGSAMRMIGMIEVDRECPDFRQIDQAAARDLEAGHWVLAFPEGRISPDGVVVAESPLQTVGLTEHDVARLREQARNVICSAHRDLVMAMTGGAA